ncbi:MAG: hypothetical protein HZB25_06580 [Candidatus Eisenbacteria bacterium]|nr:hypothetical protein [Candidatus Eisenbacteria bacterium]
MTRLLQAARGGDDAAREQLFQAMYAELHGIARQHMSHERPPCLVQGVLLPGGAGRAVGHPEGFAGEIWNDTVKGSGTAALLVGVAVILLLVRIRGRDGRRRPGASTTRHASVHGLCRRPGQSCMTVMRPEGSLSPLERSLGTTFELNLVGEVVNPPAACRRCC